MLKKIRELSIIERKVLSVLDNNYKNVEQISKDSQTNIDSSRRAVEWLGEKGFAQINEKQGVSFSLTEEGEKALSKGMPEEVILKTLEKEGELSFSELEKKTGLEKKELMAGIGINKRNAFIIVSSGKVSLTGVHEDHEKKDLKKTLTLIYENKKVSEKDADELLSRGLVEKKTLSERLVKISPKGLDAKKILSEEKIEREYDVEAPVPKIFLGKKAPYNQFLLQIRRKLVELGFQEMYSPLIVSEFYNFDVLYQPQNHPARTWTDSYQIKKPVKGTLPDKKIVNAIKTAHENGGKSDSKGWNYKWSEDIASRLVPVMHTTAHSARQLVNGVKIPGKYFSIARCFRPDVLDATHLLEFNQMEGFVVGKDIDFTHLLGMLKDFATEIAGAEKVKFFPDYYPFTEPSVQLSAKHPELGWIEFGGAGMFRPEMLENLGIEGEAMAWGLGIDRLAMFKLGINDIRYLFTEDLGYLRKAKGVLL